MITRDNISEAHVSPGQDFRVDIGARVSLGGTLKSTSGSREPRKDFEFDLKNLAHGVTNQTGHMGNGFKQSKFWASAAMTTLASTNQVIRVRLVRYAYLRRTGLTKPRRDLGEPTYAIGAP